MKTYRIPRTDLVVSRIAYGCGMLGSDWHSAAFVTKTMQMLRTAYDNGITLFDLGDVYADGKSEVALGEVLKQSPGLREKIVIQSKCGVRFQNEKQHSGMSVDLSRDHIVASAEGSIRRLNTDRLDILMLHLQDALVEPEEVAQAFDELHRSGKVRHFGVSNHTVARMELLKKYTHQPLVVNQVQLGLAHSYLFAEFLKPNENDSPVDVHVYAGTIDYCRLHDVQLQAYSPLKGGNVHRAPELVNPRADATPGVTGAAKVLADLAKEKASTPAAVALAWLLRHPAAIVPIIGTSDPRHLVENCTADSVVLSREEWYSLFSAAGRQLG
jgi:predicted oxidoreductase